MSSVQEKDIFFYGCASMALDNVVTNIGGAIDTAKKVVFAPLSASGSLAAISEAAGDTGGTINIWGRDTTGAIVTASISLNGTAEVVNTAQAFERILRTTKTSSTTGTVALYSVATTHAGTSTAAGSFTITLAGDASAVDNFYQFDVVKTDGQVKEIVKYIGSTKVAHVRGEWTTLPIADAYTTHEGVLFDKGPNEITDVRRVFYNSAANAALGSAATFYEKIFVYNQHTTKSLTSSQLAEVAEGLYANISFAIAATLGGSSTNGAGNTRKDIGDWSGRVFDSSAKTLGSGADGNLTPLGSQEVFLELGLPAGTAAANSFYKLRTSGQST